MLKLFGIADNSLFYFDRWLVVRASLKHNSKKDKKALG